MWTVYVVQMVELKLGINLESTARKIVLHGLFKAVKPLARLLLATGIGYREFAEISKKAFVSVASVDHGLRGRPTNISRVAVMTGLTRKEVRRLRDLLEESIDNIPLVRSPANMVLSAWYSDEKFLDTTGSPAALAVAGDGLTFEELVKDYGGDVPPVALLKELERGRAVCIENEVVKPLTRFFEPSPMDEEYLSSSFFSISNLLTTIVHNSVANRVVDGFPERYVFSQKLDPARIEQFRQMVEESSFQYLTSLDDWLVGHELAFQNERQESIAEQSQEVGVGLYFFKSPNT
jgi:hypothetical protein